MVGGLVFAAKWMFLFQRCLCCSSSFTPGSHWSTDPPPPLPLQDRCCCEGPQDEEEQKEEGLSEVEAWLLTGFIVWVWFLQHTVRRFNPPCDPVRSAGLRNVDGFPS